MSATAEQMNDQFSIENAPIIYNVTDAALEQLRQKYGPLTKITLELEDKEGYAQVKEATDHLRKLRLGVEDRRKELKKDALEYGRKVDSIAKNITEQLRELEDPLKQIKQTVDDEKERIKQEKIIAEQKRMEAIQGRIAKIKKFQEVHPSTTSDVIKDTIETVKCIVVDESFEEFQTEAQHEKDSTLLILDGALARREKWEAEEKQRKEEEARLQAEREKLQKEKEELERQKREIEQQKAESEKREREEQIRKEAEQKAAEEQKRKQEEEQKAEQARKEEEARKAALAPDKDKLKQFSIELRQWATNNSPVSLNDRSAAEIISEAGKRINRVCDFITGSADQL